MTPNFGRMVVYSKINKLTRTLIFGRMAVQKGRMYERGPYILVERSCGNKINKLMINENPNFWLNDCPLKKE